MNTAAPKRRIASIDQFRGFAIMSMILVNYFAYYLEAPGILRHAKGDGLTLADLVAPFFLVAIGTVSKSSLQRHIALHGRFAAYGKALRRNALLILIGCGGSMLMRLKFDFAWGVLQAIGLAGIIALPLALSSWHTKLPVILAVCVGYQLFAEHAAQLIGPYNHGGPAGALMWSLLILLGEAAADLIDFGNLAQTGRRLLALSALSILIGGAFFFFAPPNKTLLTPTYILFSGACSVLVLLAFIFLCDAAQKNIPTLTAMGRNALLLFLMHNVLLKATYYLLGGGVSSMIVGTLLIYGLCAATAVLLNRRQWYLKL